jgi:hypothetical protein
MVDEETAFLALFALIARMQWVSLSGNATQQFVTSSRRVKLFADCPVFPGCYQAEHTSMVSKKRNGPYREEWGANWIIYHNVGQDENIVAATENNRIMASVRAVMKPLPNDPGVFDNRNTLGGLVYDCFLDGRLFKDPGDLDGEGMLVVPIKLLVP